MIQSNEPIQITVPRDLLVGLTELSSDATDRMHELLERNTDGELVVAETRELEFLVRVAQLSEIARAAMDGPGRGTGAAGRGE